MRIGGGRMRDHLPQAPIKPMKSSVYDDYARLQRKVAELTLENKRLMRELRMASKNAC